MTTQHLSDEILQEYIDGALSDDGRRIAEQHLAECARCRLLFNALRRIDRSLRTMPGEHAGENVSRSVLLSLGIKPPTPLLYRIVENFAYLFGFLLVAGVSGTVYFLAGVIDTQHIKDTGSIVAGLIDSTGGYWRDIIASASLTLKTYLPFIFESANLRIGITTALVLAILALADGFFRKHILSGRYRPTSPR